MNRWLPSGGAHVERPAAAEQDPGRLALLHVVLERLEVDAVALAVLRREDREPRPDGGHGVVDGVERLHPRHAVGPDLDGALGVADVRDVHAGAAAGAVDAADDEEVPVRRGREVLGLRREAAQLAQLGQVLPGADVLRVVAALHPRLPPALHLVERLVQDAAHERPEHPRPGGATAAGLVVALGEQERVLEEALDLLLAVDVGDEGDAGLSELVGRDVPPDPVLGERQDVVPLAGIRVPDEVAQEQVGLGVDAALRVVLGDPFDEPERQELDGGAVLVGGLVQLLDGELVHHLVRGHLDEPRVVAEVRHAHLEVGRGRHAEDALAHLEDVLRLELALGGEEDVRDPPRRAVVELVHEARVRALDRRERAARLGELVPVVVQPDPAGAAAGRRDVHVLPVEAIPGDLVLAGALRQHERLVERLLRTVGHEVHRPEGVPERGRLEPEVLRRGSQRGEAEEREEKPSHPRDVT